MFLHSVEDLRTVNLAQHNVFAAHAGDCVGLTPPIAVEHRERMNVRVPITDAGMPPKCQRIGPRVAMGDLYTLRARRGARGVVDRCGGVLVWFPCGGLRLAIAERCKQCGVVDPVEHNHVLNCHVFDHVVLLRVHQEHPGTGMLDDVVDLFGVQSEVDGHQYASVLRSAPEGNQELRGVWAHYRYPVTYGQTHVLESTCHTANAGIHLSIGERSNRTDSAWLVNDADAVAVHLHGSVQKVSNGEWNLHDSTYLRKDDDKFEKTT